ncbi:DUF2188 domain-containing protein [Dactylosporangium sucinum]|uniref:DUF2188 domain-containing protein n=1 Tax=Dactylosporangium sucinum TaxID=1424081 RepID=A0A917U2H3_9ACTN|nr:DUF2188 domain-containing protein [Dactylosporangium sucinum]GGM50503.1 hypothetical protein GCM10007977_060310 [Dactylosporangium sucinum]
MANERHVTQRPDGDWDVSKPGRTRPVATETTQKAAIDAARVDLSSHGGGEIVIHGRDGRIRDKDTVAPGHDPNPPRDRR